MILQGSTAVYSKIKISTLSGYEPKSSAPYQIHSMGILIDADGKVTVKPGFNFIQIFNTDNTNEISKVLSYM